MHRLELLRSGIYIIRHDPCGRVSVGQAAKIGNRWSTHKATLNRNKHHCSYLQNAWNKYGANEFSFRVLQFGNLDVLNDLEIKWYNRYKGRLFNIHPPGKNARGFKHTEATKAKMKAGSKIAANTPEQKLMRSERAKRQHAQGVIPYRKVVDPVRTCEKCGRVFNRYKFHRGGRHPGYTCLVCKAKHHYQHGGNFNINNYDVPLDEFDDAAYELTWCRPYPGLPE